MGQVLAVLRKTIRSLHEKGFRKTVFLIARNALLLISDWREQSFDRARNVQTTGSIPIASLLTLSDNKFAEDYVPTPFSIIKRSIESIPEDLSDFTFIDVGSGKGRVLFTACAYSFRRVIGVEFSQVLHDHCTNNIARLNSRYNKAQYIESILEDALQYDLPNENLVIFMFNPFQEKIMKAFVERIESHIRKTGKKTYIIYYNPRYGHHLQESQLLRPIPYKEPLLLVSIRSVWPVALFEGVLTAVPGDCLQEPRRAEDVHSSPSQPAEALPS